MPATLKPNDLDAHFMPFTPNLSFKKKPRLMSGAKGMYYYDDAGRELLDSSAGLWCVNAGHNHPKIVEAIQKQAAAYDYVPNFGYAHPLSFHAATRLCAVMPKGFGHVLYSNSGSEAVDTAVKLALGYQRARGKGTKVKIIGRERAYHGVNIGGTAIGGIPGNRKAFGLNLMANVDHLPHTFDLSKQAFSRGQPEWGGHLADALENLVALHDADNIAAVIVEPVMGSTGVLPPPQGYLEKLQALCRKHDILFILDEVITAFGRLGRGTAAEYFGLDPDIIITAKGINSGAVPMGGTFIKGHIYDAFQQAGEYAASFFHGYTYSGHPLACAAALAAQDVYRDEGLFENAARMEKPFADALHGLKGAPHVIDIRTIGLMGAVELDPGARNVPHEMSRAMEVMDRMFWEQDTVMRFTGNVLAFSPPLIVRESHVAQLVGRLGAALAAVK